MKYSELFRATEEKYGLPRGYLARTAQIESSGNPNAKNPKSSAGGLFQFIDSTAANYGLKNRFDPYEATDAAGRLARDNQAHLRRVLGREPTAAELYLAHQQGAGGAEKLLKDPNRIIGGDEVTLNGGRNGQTAGEFASQWLNKFDGTNPGAYERPVGAVPEDYGAYADIEAQTGPTLAELLEKRKAGPQPFDSFGDEVSAAWDQTMTSQFFRRMSEGQFDPEWTLGEDRAVEHMKRLPDQYHDLLLGASSEQNFQDRLKWIEEDLVKSQRLAAGGWSATGAQLLTGVADPIPLAAGLATGGLGTAARLGWAGRAAVGAAYGAASGAAIDYAAQELIDDPHANPLMAAAFGSAFGALGGAFAKRTATADLADVAYKSAGRVNQAAHRTVDPNAVPVNDPSRNMGAAGNTSLMDDLIPAERAYLGEISDTAVPTAYGGKARFDVAGQMTTSKNPLIRALGFHIFDDNAGTTSHSVTGMSVSTRQRTIDREVWGNFNYEYQSALNGFFKANGVARMNIFERARVAREFSEAVFNYHVNPNRPSAIDPNIKSASDAWARAAEDYRVRANEAGLSDLKADPFYAPLIADGRKVADYNRRFEASAIENAIKVAIKKATPTLDDAITARMAKGYWRNIRKSAYGIEDGPAMALHRGDKDAFAEAINKHLDENELLMPDDIDGLWRALGGGAEESGSAKGVGYLKKRTLLDYNEAVPVRTRDGKIENFRVLDLFDHNLESVGRRYSRTMSGRVAFASSPLLNPSKGETIMDGIRSEADVKRLENMIRNAAMKDGDISEAELENQIQNLWFGWNRINGIPHWGKIDQFGVWARRLKTSQFIRLMSNMGLNQFQEGWKLMSLTGFRASLSQMPAIRHAFHAVASGKHKADELLDELSTMTGIGLEGLGTRFDFRMDDDRIGEVATGRIGQRLDQALDVGSAMTSQISLMRVVQTYQQRWALKAITQQMANLAKKMEKPDGTFDMSKLRGKEAARMASLGMGQDEMNLVLRNLLDNAQFDGNRIKRVDPQGWDADALDHYRFFLNRYVDRIVQQNDHGALSKWMSRPVAGMFVQFRSFVFGAWAKSLLWNMNHMDMKIAGLIIGEIAMGTATYMIRQAGQLATEEQRKKFLEEDLNPVNLVANGIARTATASALPMFIDAFMARAPEFEVGGHTFKGGLFGNARSSGSPTDAILGTPVVGQIDAAMKGLWGVGRAAFTDDRFTQSDANNLKNAIPLPLNYVPLAGALGALIKELPTKR